MPVRRASVADATVLAMLHAESFGAAGWSIAQIADSLALPTTFAWIAEENRMPVGFSFCQNLDDEGDILTFCTRTIQRRQGIGRRLLDTALNAARQTGMRCVFLEAAVDNAAALSLYEKAGFILNGKRRGYYRRQGQSIDAVMLKLDVFDSNSAKATS